MEIQIDYHGDRHSALATGGEAVSRRFRKNRCFCDSLQEGRKRRLFGVNWRGESGRLLRQEIDLPAPFTLVGLQNGVYRD